ncbi:hypothetical protein [Sphingomonas sp. ID0503]|uniref:hypothetical protein n=1 Tax=Sphingomonas sp. ID0503 TaxID=3399691 RepID=UPI003AFABB83
MRSGAAFAGALYLAVAILCVFVSVRRQKSSIWLWIGLIVAALGIARGFDLSFRVANIVRQEAVDEGAYAARRSLQWASTRMLVLGLAAVEVAIFFLFRRLSIAARVAMAAVLPLMAVAIIRIISLHELDVWLSDTSVLSLSRAKLIETGCLGLIAWAAGTWLERAPPRKA